MPKQLSLFDDPSFYESGDLEFKSAKGGVPGSLWETYSSFANTNGGTIYLGIAEKGTTLDMHGVSDASQQVDNIWSSLHNSKKVNINILSSNEITIVDMGSLNPVIRINVPRASREQRPIYINNDPFSGTYRRDHTGDYKCSPEEVRRMFADQSILSADSRLLEGFTLSDLHAQSLAQYRNRFASSQPNHPWLLENDLSLLTRLGGWRRDRVSNQEGLTVAGLLMFGQEQAIRSPEALPQFHLDYRERLGAQPSERWSDRITLDGTWEGNLFQFYNRIMPRLAMTLKTPFQLDANSYRIDESSVAEGLREAVVNSIIHSDYFGQGGIVYDRYGDRIELSNPGTLLLSLEQLLRGGVSECRNKALQVMFQMMGAGDKAGSGMDRIRTSWDGAKLRTPRIRETQRPDRVTLTLPMVSLLPEEALTGLRSMFGTKCDSLLPDEIQILVMALEEGAITNARLQEVLTVHRTELTKTLQHLVKSGLLRRIGTGRWTRYELRDASRTIVQARQDAANDVDPTSDPTSGITSGITSDASTKLLEPDKQAEVGQIGAGVDETLRGLWPQLALIGNRARGTLLSVNDQEDVVIELCRVGGWLNSHQIASLMGRNATSLRRRLLSGMVERGILKLRFPTARNNPFQAYTVKGKD
ncbi:ATP-binding protein [Sphingomonas sp. UV9]|uniref:ATP-binding protein n=1 Tax=Sphingomonas sp. UV9 TaxID=1851410 RepID=UPI001F0B87B5|nr:ATP-binding protein [Sphingomonas sp. UV9]